MYSWFLLMHTCRTWGAQLHLRLSSFSGFVLCVAILQGAVQVRKRGRQDWRQKLRVMEFAAFRGTAVTKWTFFFFPHFFFPHFCCDAKHLHILVINNLCLEKKNWKAVMLQKTGQNRHWERPYYRSGKSLLFITLLREAEVPKWNCLVFNFDHLLAVLCNEFSSYFMSHLGAKTAVAKQQYQAEVNWGESRNLKYFHCFL